MTPEDRLDAFIDKFTPEIAARTRRVLTAVRARTPGAFELVYDNYNALTIGFGSTERTSEAILSVAVWPRSVTLFFLRGALLDDPDKLLTGSGTRGRHLADVDEDSFARPEVEALIARALASAHPPFDAKGPRTLIIKSASTKQRPRRPTLKAPRTKARKKAAR